MVASDAAANGSGEDPLWASFDPWAAPKPDSSPSRGLGNSEEVPRSPEAQPPLLPNGTNGFSKPSDVSDQTSPKAVDRDRGVDPLADYDWSKKAPEPPPIIVHDEQFDQIPPPVVRAPVRVITGTKGVTYGRLRKPDDVIVVPEMFCSEDDQSLYTRVEKEVKAQQALGKDPDWATWHEGCHPITKRPDGCPTLCSILDKVCVYFNIEKSSMTIQLNLYSDCGGGTALLHDKVDMSPMHNTIARVSLGSEREVTLMHVESRAVTSVFQTNGALVACGQGVALNAPPVAEAANDGMISIIVCGCSNRPSPNGMQLAQPQSTQLQRRGVRAVPGAILRLIFSILMVGLWPLKRLVKAALDRSQARRRALGNADPWAGASKGLRERREPRGMDTNPRTRGGLNPSLQDTGADAWGSYQKQGRSMMPGQNDSIGHPSPYRDRGFGSDGGFGAPRFGAAHAAMNASMGPTGYAAMNAESRGGSRFTERPAGYGAPRFGPEHAAMNGALNSVNNAIVGGFFEDTCKCTRDEYITKHIDYAFQDLVRKANLGDQQLFRLGKAHFKDQADTLKRFTGGEQAMIDFSAGNGLSRGDEEKGKGKGGGKGKPRGGSDDHGWWGFEEDEIEENPFWWRSQVEELLFDLPLSPVKLLTQGAPTMCQWWDVEHIAESDFFVAIVKPAGMFVVTDQRGLWEVSPTNFIHVAHQRYEMPSHDEPRQRGICHRLDSHTSGIQIFGKSWEAFRHFTVQNSAHRTQKEYMCVVAGRLGPPNMPETGLVDVPMKKWQDFTRREFGSVICAHDGLPAVTKYRAIRHYYIPARGKTKFWGEGRWFSLVQIRILTGRTHQIRVHMAFLGHPLIGDVKYSNPSLVEKDYALVPRIFLHCVRMEFEDMDGTTFVAASDLAADLQVALGRIQAMATDPPEDDAAGGLGVLSWGGGKFDSGRGAIEDSKSGSISEYLELEKSAKISQHITGGFSGLQGLLDSGEKFAPPQADPCADGANPIADPPSIVWRCDNCLMLERATCGVRNRKGKKGALYWKVTKLVDDGKSDRRKGRGKGNNNPDEEKPGDAPKEEEPVIADTGKLPWGPGLLWTPTELIDRAAQAAKVTEDGTLTKEEMEDRFQRSKAEYELKMAEHRKMYG